MVELKIAPRGSGKSTWCANKAIELGDSVIVVHNSHAVRYFYTTYLRDRRDINVTENLRGISYYNNIIIDEVFLLNEEKQDIIAEIIENRHYINVYLAGTPNGVLGNLRLMKVIAKYYPEAFL